MAACIGPQRPLSWPHPGLPPPSQLPTAVGSWAATHSCYGGTWQARRVPSVCQSKSVSQSAPERPRPHVHRPHLRVLGDQQRLPVAEQLAQPHLDQHEAVARQASRHLHPHLHDRHMEAKRRTARACSRACPRAGGSNRSSGVRLGRHADSSVGLHGWHAHRSTHRHGPANPAMRGPGRVTQDARAVVPPGGGGGGAVPTHQRWLPLRRSSSSIARRNSGQDWQVPVPPAGAHDA